jgi:hypothetical protein
MQQWPGAAKKKQTNKQKPKEDWPTKETRLLKIQRVKYA